MRVLIVVCIYDRLENLKKWVHAWKQCDRTDAKLIIIHNVDKFRMNPFSELCRKNGISYIMRKNIGFETGIIQDLFLNRLSVKYDWDALLFATDDTIPMSTDFIQQYRNEVSKPEVGAACMEVSGVWTPHIRTTGFCLRKEIAKNIHWVYDPVSTKEHCYFFEHQGFEDTIMSQILKMDKRVIQLSSINESVMWDTDHTKLDRWQEWNDKFPGYQ